LGLLKWKQMVNRMLLSMLFKGRNGTSPDNKLLAID
jgi:hypothetical protein